MDINVKQLFLRFLKENDIYNSYIRNAKNSLINEEHMFTARNKNICSVKRLIDYHSNLCPLCLVAFGFIWGDAPEGGHFWLSVSNKWQEFYVTEYNKRIKTYCSASS